MKRGAIDSFFKPSTPKKPKYEVSTSTSNHPSYPFPIPHLPPSIAEQLGFAPAEEGQTINDQRDLDLIYYQPYIPSSIAPDLFDFLRKELFFQRVVYNIKRGDITTTIHTPRFTTVFGVDSTSLFTSPTPDGDGVATLVDAQTNKPIERTRYKCTPRPLPQCLDTLRKLTQGTTGETFNFCLVNYYADGNDSISYHSDDERFLGANPAIASFSLGARRDFLMKHKPVVAPTPKDREGEEFKVVKLGLGSGDMVLMRGATQANWLHSVPKRKGEAAGRGRINVTFRRALVREGTENYYRYNVGDGGVFRWDEGEGRMVDWKGGRE
ncbi:DNA repair family protein [Aaosphaeria arxii CBS 175.79]|uniref:DNA repair family protein n=1 Tax=Aaosphaeria arxii CBS 175.79 TaxID=1450172 RepID=A0A6A5Y4X1_9PLEO|nr:DNA repair family protein [Aaosphaeria arxii CBS 175.79]KAF2019901.1 DNA repair family protein [Aaosphaeria arxii CBS 175.79]